MVVRVKFTVPTHHNVSDLPNPLCRTAVAQPSLPTGEEWRDSSLESSHPPTSVAVAGFTGSWPPGFLARESLFPLSLIRSFLIRPKGLVSPNRIRD